jgi:hypothetical protein
MIYVGFCIIFLYPPNNYRLVLQLRFWPKSDSLLAFGGGLDDGCCGLDGNVDRLARGA